MTGQILILRSLHYFLNRHWNATRQFIKINSQLKDDQSADKHLLDKMTNIKCVNVKWLYKSEIKIILDLNGCP